MRKRGMARGTIDKIPAAQAGTLAGLFRERVRRTPHAIAYRHYHETTGQWQDSSWADTAAAVARWQAGFASEHLRPGERVAILMRNCRDWVVFDQAALGCGLVVVPLYVDDRPENTAYILNDAGVTLLYLRGAEQWERLLTVHDELGTLSRILTQEAVSVPAGETRVRTVGGWLPEDEGELRADDGEAGQLATIVYTSGTTGRPKGVMLSHSNILANADSGLEYVPMYQEDVLLSFLPLSHTFERTVGYYAPMMTGATVAYARSIPQLAEDLLIIRPTVLISVPRIYERVYNRIMSGLAEKPPIATRLFKLAVDTGWRRFLRRQGRGGWHPSFLLWPLLDKLVAGKIMARLGGRLRLAAAGGAPLPPAIARVFIGLGLNLLQGYGLTETSPIIACNTAEDNDPASVGIPLGNVEVRIGENDELLTRGPCVMLGYWERPDATRDIIDADGWLHTGDRVRIERSHIYITGRLKEIIVMANGEKVPPADMEMAIALDPLFEQVLVLGESRPYLSAIIVLNAEQWIAMAATLALDPANPAAHKSAALERAVLERLAGRLSEFPGYAQVRRVACTLEPWTVDTGLITPTMKLKRDRIMARYENEIAALYKGH
jgi:long-chain acyl-CoA synthetase